MSDVIPDSLFADRFEIQRVLGEGNTGKVYLAEDRIRRERVLIKVLHEDVIEDAGGWDASIETLRQISSLNHPGIGRINDFNRRDGRVYLIMEFIEGAPLLETMGRQSIHRNLSTMRKWIRQSLDSLDWASNVTGHGGIKPSNLWVDAQGGLKLLDFGLNKLLSLEKRKALAVAGHHAQYLAPEYFNNSAVDDFKADQFALARVFSDLLESGVFPGHDIGEKELLLQHLRNMMHTDPEKRFRDPTSLRLAFADSQRVSAMARFNKLFHGVRGDRFIKISTALFVILFLYGSWNWFGKQRRHAANRTQTVAGLIQDWRIYHHQRMKLLQGLEKGHSTGEIVWDHLDPWNELPWLESFRDLKVSHPTLSELTFKESSGKLKEDLNRFRFRLELIHSCIDALGRIRIEQPKLPRLYELTSVNLPSDLPGLESLERTLDRLIRQGSHQHAADLTRAHLEKVQSLKTAVIRRIGSDADTQQQRWYRLLDQAGLPGIDVNRPLDKALKKAKADLAGGLDLEACISFVEIARQYRDDIDSMKAIPAPEPGHWVNSLGMRFVDCNGWKASIWETRILDYAVFIHHTGADHRFIWREDAARPGIEPTHPVTSVTLFDAEQFCAWLTDHERDRGLIAGDWAYRLPGDLEWSRMAGLKDEQGEDPWERGLARLEHWPWGPDGTRKPDHGNYYTPPTFVRETFNNRNDPFVTTSPVGSFPANSGGLYDLGGNVWEFTSDIFNANQAAFLNADRSARGGSWRTVSLEIMKTGYRLAARVDRTDFGFRCILAPN